MRTRLLLGMISLTAIVAPVRAAEPPSRDAVKSALSRATAFMSETISRDGGYVWVSSPTASSGTAKAWPGRARSGSSRRAPRPSGMAFLEAFDATGDPAHLTAARATTAVLVNGQLRSGGWYYRVEQDPAKRREFAYRDGRPIPTEPTPAPGGWDVWRKRRHKNNITVIDDDTTPAALRFLMRVDRAMKFEDRRVHDAVEYGLTSVRNAQHPIGAWSHNYDQFPTEPPSAEYYPILKASYPPEWSRTWTKDFTGGYVLNDRITQNTIATMLLAARIYDNADYRACAERGGEFLRLAQLPDPQPAWAQQYDRKMHPVWDRPFEPPAVSGLESQDVLETLLHLYRETGDKKYLAPIPAALSYLKTCELPDKTLARFYELKTNRPIYFNKKYKIVYDKGDLPTHYGFAFPSRLAAIEAEYTRLQNLPASELRVNSTPALTADLTAAVGEILASQSPTGGWLEPGTVRNPAGRKVKPAGGVVQSQTFIENVSTLCKYLNATK